MQWIVAVVAWVLSTFLFLPFLGRCLAGASKDESSGAAATPVLTVLTDNVVQPLPVA